MTDRVSRAADPVQYAEISRELRARIDEAATSREPGPKLSLEARWILPGQLATAMTEWFARFPARVESREDTYLVDPRPGQMSVKFRQGKLELKVYQGSAGILEVAGCARGRLESWEKWSFPCHPPGRSGADLLGWRPVRKLIRRFPAANRQSAAAVRGRGEKPRCEVELTEIGAGGQAWWTLAFEATGPASQLRTQLKATAALVFAQPLPGGMELATEHSQSYLQWLTGSQPVSAPLVLPQAGAPAARLGARPNGIVVPASGPRYLTVPAAACPRSRRGQARCSPARRHAQKPATSTIARAKAWGAS